MLTNISVLFILLHCVECVLPFQNVNATQKHHPTRCICKCKGNDNFPSYAVYIESPFANGSSCTCPKTVLPRIDIQLNKSTLYCLGCVCKYERRSLTKIQISVSIVIIVISTLLMYGCCLFCLKPISKRQLDISRKRDISTVFQEQRSIIGNYESFGVYDSLGQHTGDFSTTPSHSPRYIFKETFKKLVNIQDKWNEKLEIQRSKIYK
jgi:hypothetical protein